MASVCNRDSRHDVTFKLRVVNCAEKESKEAAAKDFGVDTKTRNPSTVPERQSNCATYI